MVEQPRQEQHKMEVVYSYPSGADELYCPICGRRLVIQWPPEYKKIILEPGDQHAIHSAGKGGLELGSPQLAQKPQDFAQDASVSGAADDAVQLGAQDEARLMLWEQWLNQMDFDKLW